MLFAALFWLNADVDHCTAHDRIRTPVTEQIKFLYAAVTRCGIIRAVK